MDKILYVAIDVDDNAFHGSGFEKFTGEYYNFKCKPTFGALSQKLKTYQQKGYSLRVCYEATYLGFPLCRQLRTAGIDTNVIAPSLIPSTSRDRIKTDRLDCQKLARYYSLGELTAVSVPDEKDQQVRDYIRLRDNFVGKRTRNRQELLSLCTSYDIRYKVSEFAENHKNKIMENRKENGKPTTSEYEVDYWTSMHYDWLQKAISSLDVAIRVGFEALISMDKTLTETIENFEKTLDQIADEDRYRDQVLALCTLKGVQILTALKFITELGDIRRFSHPSKLVSYLGINIEEYSSGGKERKYGITKMGNRRLRTAAVESVQFVKDGTTISKRLQSRRRKVVPEISAIAVRCQTRLRSRWHLLVVKGKHRNKVKMACARELVCFIWEILTKVAEMKENNMKIAI